MLRKILLICGIVSSVWYVITDVIGTLRYPGYSYTDQWFSELTAEGAPTRPLMIALNEIPYNLLVLAGFAAFGFVTGVVFPMSTREVAAAGEDTLRNTMHLPGTAVMSLSLVLAMAFGSTLLGKRFRYYTYATIVTLVVFGVLASLQAGRIATNEPTPWGEIYERMNIYPTMLWVAVLVIGLLRAQKAR